MSATITRELATWASSLRSEDIPLRVRTRAKHLLLDGIGSALVGAQLPWSRTATEAVLEFEGTGAAPIIGWGRTTSAPAAALLNGTFIQGFELDDFHPLAPVHTTSLLVPALLAAAEVAGTSDVTGEDLVRAAVVGFEIAPRVGLALHGADMLTRGWHSGAVFGPPAVAAAVGNLLHLDPSTLEHAVALGATQACGLMAAQFGAMSKRMHHGFAARNGLYAALLARRGYTGIENVFDLPWGGFLSVFGEGHAPDASQLVDGLGERWETERIVVKPHAAQGGLHAAIDIVLEMRRAEHLRASDVARIDVDLSEPIYHHSWWAAERPIAPIGAQMHIGYAVAVALLDGQVLARQFAPARIDRDDVWNLIPRITAHHRREYDDLGPMGRGQTEVRVTLENGKQLTAHRLAARTALEPLRNDDVVAKFGALTEGIVDAERQRRVIALVTMLDEQPAIGELLDVLAGPVRSPFDAG